MLFHCGSAGAPRWCGVLWSIFQSTHVVHAVRLDVREDARARPESFGVHLVREIEHVGAPFTQGLEFTAAGDLLVETSGSYPAGTASFVRTLDPETGQVRFRTRGGLEEHGNWGGGRFVEGITQLEVGPESHWFASTFTDHVAIEYDHELNKVAEHDFPFTGWGLTRNTDGSAFFATNGTADVMELRLGNAGFEVGDVKTATCLGRSVTEINELEMVDDFMGRGAALLGNLYRSRVVLVLDPDTMRCTGAFHLEGLGAEDDGERWGNHVANGIAFNKHTGKFIVTGKNWEKMFEISVEEEPADGAGRALELLAHRLGVDRSA